jgi:hypothetical protein
VCPACRDAIPARCLSEFVGSSDSQRLRKPSAVLNSDHQHVGKVTEWDRAIKPKADLTLKDVETRLANWLVKRCPDPQSEKPVRIELTVTKRVLAAELGTISETISRTLAKFREQILLTVKGEPITVLSPARLSVLLRRNLGE